MAALPPPGPGGPALPVFLIPVTPETDLNLLNQQMAEASAAGNRVHVSFAPRQGFYSLPQPLELPANTTVSAETRKTHVLHEFLCALVVTGNNCCVRNMTISAGTMAPVIAVAGITGLELDNLMLRNISICKSAIDLMCGGATLSNITISGAGSGMAGVWLRAPTERIRMTNVNFSYVGTCVIVGDSGFRSWELLELDCSLVHAVTAAKLWELRVEPGDDSPQLRARVEQVLAANKIRDVSRGSGRRGGPVAAELSTEFTWVDVSRIRAAREREHLWLLQQKHGAEFERNRGGFWATIFNVPTGTNLADLRELLSKRGQVTDVRQFNFSPQSESAGEFMGLYSVLYASEDDCRDAVSKIQLYEHPASHMLGKDVRVTDDKHCERAMNWSKKHRDLSAAQMADLGQTRSSSAVKLETLTKQLHHSQQLSSKRAYQAGVSGRETQEMRDQLSQQRRGETLAERLQRLGNRLEGLVPLFKGKLHWVHFIVDDETAGVISASSLSLQTILEAKKLITDLVDGRVMSCGPGSGHMQVDQGFRQLLVDPVTKKCVFENRQVECFVFLLSMHSSESGELIVEGHRPQHVSVKKILELWSKHASISDQTLVIILDTCYAGQQLAYVRDWCGRVAGIKVVVQAACRSDEKALSGLFCAKWMSLFAARVEMVHSEALGLAAADAKQQYEAELARAKEGHHADDILQHPIFWSNMAHGTKTDFVYGNLLPFFTSSVSSDPDAASAPAAALSLRASSSASLGVAPMDLD